MAYEHRLPATLNPLGDICVSLFIPADIDYHALLLGVIRQLEDINYYERDDNYDDTGAQTVSAQWRERTITPLIEALANGESCSVMSVPTGSAMQYFGTSAPDGWLFCDGAAISRTTYADLFSVIGTTYGVGNGSSTFNLPDMRGRAAIGAGQGTGLTNRALGAIIGAETHQISTNEMPSHSHNRNSSGLTESILQNGSSGGIRAFASGSLQTLTLSVTGTAGANSAHNNMQPSLVTNFIIRS